MSSGSFTVDGYFDFVTLSAVTVASYKHTAQISRRRVGTEPSVTIFCKMQVRSSDN